MASGATADTRLLNIKLLNALIVVNKLIVSFRSFLNSTENNGYYIYVFPLGPTNNLVTGIYRLQQ